MKLTLCAIALTSLTGIHAVDVTSIPRTGLVLPSTLLQHHAELGITPEQGEKLRGLREESMQQSASLEAAVKEQQQALESMVQDPEIKPEAASEQLKKLLDAEAAVKQLQLRLLLSLRAALTPEQRAQAIKLGGADASHQEPQEDRLKEKGRKLKTAFDSLGIPLPEALKPRGAAIENLVHQGQLAEAEQAIDKLAADVGLNDPSPTPTIDFDKFETGSTDLENLKDRYAAVQEKAKAVIYLPTLRLLLQGREELEKAKATEDVNRAGRLLTWAEGVLAKQ